MIKLGEYGLGVCRHCGNPGWFSPKVHSQMAGGELTCSFCKRSMQAQLTNRPEDVDLLMICFSCGHYKTVNEKTIHSVGRLSCSNCKTLAVPKLSYSIIEPPVVLTDGRQGCMVCGGVNINANGTCLTCNSEFQGLKALQPSCSSCGKYSGVIYVSDRGSGVHQFYCTHCLEMFYETAEQCDLCDKICTPTHSRLGVISYECKDCNITYTPKIDKDNVIPFPVVIGKGWQAPRRREVQSPTYYHSTTIGSSDSDDWYDDYSSLFGTKVDEDPEVAAKRMYKLDEDL